MPRNREDVRRRLQQAALQLFAQQGFERTTAAEIAAGAGVTERTFFRHYADKRDILFDGEDRLQAALIAAINAAPDNLAPLQILRLAFRSVGPVFEANRAFSEPRQKVIAATPALREREAGKMAAMMSAVSAALQERGVDADLATLTVQIGAAAFNFALTAWLADGAEGFNAHLERAFANLRALAQDGHVPERS